MAALGFARPRGEDPRAPPTRSTQRFPSRRTSPPRLRSRIRNRYWRALVQVDRVFKVFRARSSANASPVHLFWGARPRRDAFLGTHRAAPSRRVPNLPDLGSNRGRTRMRSASAASGPLRPIPYPRVSIAYAYPEPSRLQGGRASEPTQAFYSNDLSEFVLPYDAVRSRLPRTPVRWHSRESTYDPAARLGDWDAARVPRYRNMESHRAEIRTYGRRHRATHNGTAPRWRTRDVDPDRATPC
jgi:hypothetical protein